MWAAILLPLFELVAAQLPWSITILTVEVANPLTRLGVLLWFLAIGGLLLIMYQIFTLDLIGFKANERKWFRRREPLTFQHNAATKWGLHPIDEILDTKGGKPFFPTILVADETSTPWRILQRFILSGLTHGTGKENAIHPPSAVYFTFTRPPALIFKQLGIEYGKLVTESKKHPELLGSIALNFDEFLENLVIVDCYTSFARQTEVDAKHPPRCKVITADPTNPHNLDAKYEAALRYLYALGYRNVRVVLDSMSDFLYLTDTLLGSLYLRHNVVWEEDSGIESLYLFRKDTLQKEVEEYFLWFANGTLRLERKTDSKGNGYLAADFRGPFTNPPDLGPQKFNMSFDYESLPDRW